VKAMPRPLFKTTIVIWSEGDGTQVELSHLAREAEIGDAYCSRCGSELITDPPPMRIGTGQNSSALRTPKWDMKVPRPTPPDLPPQPHFPW
jgi:hypothetical protein